jgi:hypothetical protein
MDALRAQGRPRAPPCACSPSPTATTRRRGARALRHRIGGKGFPANTGDIAARLPVDLVLLLAWSGGRSPVATWARARGQRRAEAAEHRGAGGRGGRRARAGRAAHRRPVAVLLYVVLCLQTFFDSREAEKVGRAAYAEARPRRPAAGCLHARPGDRPAAGAGAGHRGGDPAGGGRGRPAAGRRRGRGRRAGDRDGDLGPPRPADRSTLRRARTSGRSTATSPAAPPPPTPTSRPSCATSSPARLRRAPPGQARPLPGRHGAHLRLARAPAHQRGRDERVRGRGRPARPPAQARELRERTDLLAQSMSEAFET